MVWKFHPRFIDVLRHTQRFTYLWTFYHFRISIYSFFFYSCKEKFMDFILFFFVLFTFIFEFKKEIYICVHFCVYVNFLHREKYGTDIIDHLRLKKKSLIFFHSWLISISEYLYSSSLLFSQNNFYHNWPILSINGKNWNNFFSLRNDCLYYYKIRKLNHHNTLF